MTLVLVGTPRSHFTRKVRVLLVELGLAYEWREVPNLVDDSDAAAATFAGNPLMRVPALVDDSLAGAERTVIDSDHIARHIVATRAPHDPLGVCTDDVAALNRLALANGVMANDVTLTLLRRGGMTDGGGKYVDKLATSIDRALTTLERELASALPTPRDRLRYVDVAAACMWDHLALFQTVPGLDRYPRLASFAAELNARHPSLSSTAPPPL